jgi:hypothetical protein
MTDRSKYYVEPMKLGAAKLYESDFIADIDNAQWKQFDEAAHSGKGFKVGDFIDLSVNLTAIQMVEFLDKIKEMQSIEEVHKYCDDLIMEISKEIKLP